MRGLEKRAWIGKREDSCERVRGERASGSAGGIYRHIAIESLESEGTEGALFGSLPSLRRHMKLKSADDNRRSSKKLVGSRLAGKYARLEAARDFWQVHRVKQRPPKTAVNLPFGGLIE